MSEAAAPADSTPVTEQYPVAGDEVWIKATFMRVSHDGVYVKIDHPTRLPRGLPFQYIVVDPRAVFARLEIGRILKAYGQ